MGCVQRGRREECATSHVDLLPWYQQCDLLWLFSVQAWLGRYIVSAGYSIHEDNMSHCVRVATTACHTHTHTYKHGYVLVMCETVTICTNMYLQWLVCCV